MKPRWKWLLVILTAISFAALILLTTLNQRWEPNFLQTLKAIKNGEGTYSDNVGSWSSTRIYDLPTSYSEVVARMERELNRSRWQWSKTTVHANYNGKRQTYFGWHIQRDGHTFQIEDKPIYRSNHTAQLVWHERPSTLETYWIRFKNWLGFTPKKQP